MGTDMTVYLEVYGEKQKEWFRITKQTSNRWYQMFARIGGVRGFNESNAAYHNRGIPTDMNRWDAAHLRNPENCYHSITYYTYRELKNSVLDCTEEDYDYPEQKVRFDLDDIMGSEIPVWGHMIKALVKRYGKDNVRFVFAFDS